MLIKMQKCFQCVWPDRNLREMLLQHNTRPQASNTSQEAVTQLGWTMLWHPSYSPSLAPSDFHLFRPLKDAFQRRKFESNDDVVSAVRTWLRQQNEEWCPSGIYVIPRRCKAMELNGEFVESQDTN